MKNGGGFTDSEGVAPEAPRSIGTDAMPREHGDIAMGAEKSGHSLNL